MLKPAIVATVTSLLLFASGCGNDDPEVPQVGESDAVASVADGRDLPSTSPSGPSEDDLDRFFDLVASADPQGLEQALRMTADGSNAAAWLKMYRARSLASQQAGDPWTSANVTMTGQRYKLCRKNDCDVFGVKARGDQIADITINGHGLKGRIILGSKKKYPVDGLVTLRLIGSYKLISTGDLVIAVEANARADVTLGWTSDAYVGPNGVQGSPSATTGSSTLRNGATGTYVYTIPDAEIGGELYVTAVEDGGAQRDANATIPTG